MLVLTIDRLGTNRQTIQLSEKACTICVVDGFGDPHTPSGKSQAALTNAKSPVWSLSCSFVTPITLAEPSSATSMASVGRV
jgi:hypothetical protein